MGSFQPALTCLSRVGVVETERTSDFSFCVLLLPWRFWKNFSMNSYHGENALLPWRWHGTKDLEGQYVSWQLWQGNIRHSWKTNLLRVKRLPALKPMSSSRSIGWNLALDVFLAYQLFQTDPNPPSPERTSDFSFCVLLLPWRFWKNFSMNSYHGENALLPWRWNGTKDLEGQYVSWQLWQGNIRHSWKTNLLRVKRLPALKPKYVCRFVCWARNFYFLGCFAPPSLKLRSSVHAEKMGDVWWCAASCLLILPAQFRLHALHGEYPPGLPGAAFQ